MIEIRIMKWKKKHYYMYIYLFIIERLFFIF